VKKRGRDTAREREKVIKNDKHRVREGEKKDRNTREKEGR
jgi:hypothetical protein